MENIPFAVQIEQEREYPLRYARSLVGDDEKAHKLVEETIALAEDPPLEYKDCTSLRGWLSSLMKQTYTKNLPMDEPNVE